MTSEGLLPPSTKPATRTNSESANWSPQSDSVCKIHFKGIFPMSINPFMFFHLILLGLTTLMLYSGLLIVQFSPCFLSFFPLLFSDTSQWEENIILGSDAVPTGVNSLILHRKVGKFLPNGVTHQESAGYSSVAVLRTSNRNLVLSNIHIHIHMHTLVHTHRHIHMHVHTHIRVHTYICINIHVYIYICACTYRPIYI